MSAVVALERFIEVVDDKGFSTERSAAFFEALADFTCVENLNEVGDTGQPPFEGLWVNRSGEAVAAFYKDSFNRVSLKGAPDTGNANTTIFTLPEGYRPSEKLRFSSMQIGATTAVRVTIDTDGTVDASGGTTNGVTLSGISFRV